MARLVQSNNEAATDAYLKYAVSAGKCAFYRKGTIIFVERYIAPTSALVHGSSLQAYRAFAAPVLRASILLSELTRT